MQHEKPELIPRNISTSNDGLYISVFLTFNSRVDFTAGSDQLWLLLHDSYELPTGHSAKFVMKSHQMYEIKVNPMFYSLDDSLLNYSPEE